MELTTTTPTQAEIEATAERLHTIVYPDEAIIKPSLKWDICLTAAQSGWHEGTPRVVLATASDVQYRLYARTSLNATCRREVLDALNDLFGERPPTETQDQRKTVSEYIKIVNDTKGSIAFHGSLRTTALLEAGVIIPDPEPMSEEERIARAIYKANTGGKWDTCFHKQPYLDMAHAAIAAIATEEAR